MMYSNEINLKNLTLTGNTVNIEGGGGMFIEAS